MNAAAALLFAACFAGASAQDAPPSPPDAPRGPDATNESNAPAVAPVAGDEEPALDVLLERVGARGAAVEALEVEVRALQQTLDGLVLEGAASPDKLLAVSGVERELESLGVSRERATQVRDVSDDVRALRARLQLLKLRSATATEARPDAGFTPVGELEPYDPTRAGAPAAESATADAQDPTTGAAAGSTASGEAGGAPQDLFAGPSPDADREAVIAFRQGDLRGVVELLASREPSALSADALYVLGTTLVSERRMAEARAAFEELARRTDREALCRSAARQLDRIARLENGVVSLPPGLAPEPEAPLTGKEER